MLDEIIRNNLVKKVFFSVRIHIACFQRYVMSLGALVMPHFCEKTIAALHRLYNIIAICMMHSAHKSFNTSFLLIVVEVNRSQIMRSKVI